MTALEMIQILTRLVKENGEDLEVVCQKGWCEMRYVESVEVVSDVFEKVIAIKV